MGAAMTTLVVVLVIAKLFQVIAQGVNQSKATQARNIRNRRTVEAERRRRRNRR